MFLKLKFIVSLILVETIKCELLYSVEHLVLYTVSCSLLSNRDADMKQRWQPVDIL